MGFREDFSSEVEDARWGMWKITTRVIFPIAVICVTLGFVGRACTLASQPIAIVEKTMDADNVISNYEWFKQEYQDIQKNQANIVSAKAALDSFRSAAGSRKEMDREDKQEDARLSSIVLGLTNEHDRLVADYNAKASMANRSLFKTKDLPEHINP